MVLIKTIKVPVYSGKVIAIYFDEVDEVANRAHINKYLKYKGFNTRLGNEDGFQYEQTLRHNKHRFLLVAKLDKEAIETITHEIYHLVQAILEYNEVEYRKGSANEAYAYFTGVLSAKLISPIYDRLQSYKSSTTKSTKQKHITKSQTVLLPIHGHRSGDRAPELLSKIQEQTNEETPNS